MRKIDYKVVIIVILLLSVFLFCGCSKKLSPAMQSIKGEWIYKDTNGQEWIYKFDNDRTVYFAIDNDSRNFKVITAKEAGNFVSIKVTDLGVGIIRVEKLSDNAVSISSKLHPSMIFKKY
ncbi:MAG: hypothetical protein ABIH00_05400 [Armatimonadota bacterium]